MIKGKERRYYVYKLENVDVDVRERHVGPLINAVETFLKLKSGEGVLGVTP
ncbi:MAG: putative integrase [Sulfolobus sp.]|nr:putative integrase [Sulfolobus sp.]